MPRVDVKPDTVAIAGGMNLERSSMLAKPGTARLAHNYEWAIDGGVERLRGIEPFDGRPAPSSAVYALVECAETVAGVALGDVLEGADSGTTGKVIYLDGAFIGMSRLSGNFDEEVLELASVPVATISNLNPSIDGFLDNTLHKAAADDLQADIGKVPGSGRVRGIAVLNGVLYAWRNNVAGTELGIHKSSAAGWVPVPMFHEVAFTAGSTAYAEGSTLSQGGTSATVKRAVVESGDWGTNDAAGRLIITAPTGGVFSGGVAGGGGVVTLSGASALIVLLPDGRVRTHRKSFTAAINSDRLYGCDGVNREFEFDGDVLVPLNTGMGSIRAQAVKVHKNHLFFAYRGSLQHSAIGNPYSYSAVFGAGELSAGNTITNLVPVGGATDAAALFVTCEDALLVLYGTDAETWNLVTLSTVSGAIADTAVDIGGVVALDVPGVMRYPASQSFGNFAWDTVSMEIQSAAREQQAWCSVYVAGLFRYRLFFKDGTAITGLPVGKGKFLWSVINYDRNIVLAENAEIDGVSRTFYGDDEGWVYEADKGRSFAGAPITYALMLHTLSQGSPMVEKTYRQLQLEVKADSACTLYTSAQFNDEEGSSEQIESPQPGSGLAWDLSNYDQSYWDTPRMGRCNVPCEGVGTGVTLSVAGESDNELSHTLHVATVLYTPRKLKR